MFIIKHLPSTYFVKGFVGNARNIKHSVFLKLFIFFSFYILFINSKKQSTFLKSFFVF